MLNRTFLVRFDSIPGSFSLAMDISAPLRLAKILIMARATSTGMPLHAL